MSTIDTCYRSDGAVTIDTLDEIRDMVPLCIEEINVATLCMLDPTKLPSTTSYGTLPSFRQKSKSRKR